MLSAGEDVKQQELSHIVARMQHGAVILEKFNSFLWNCKYTYHMTQQSNCWVFTKINKNRGPHKDRMRMFVALFIIAKRRNNPTAEWISKLQYIWTMEYYLAIKM